MVAYYENFGAKGDGETDDLEAIIKTHEYANKNRIPVIANNSAIYKISGKGKPVIIQTNTDFGNAEFIIDDRSVENREMHVFEI